MSLNPIFIDALRQKVRVGCTAEERGWPQLVSIDVEMMVDTDRAAVSDSITDTVDYVAVADWIEARCSEGEWKLIEKLAADLCSGLLAQYSLIDSISVSIRKEISERCEAVRYIHRAER